MSSLPATLVRFRSDLEDAIGREHAARVRQARRRRRLVALAAAVALVVLLVSASVAMVGGFVEPIAQGRLTRTVDGVRFSLRVPGTRWENGPHERVGSKFRTRSLYVSKSIVGGQAAEAVIFWTSFPDGGEAAPCAKLLSPTLRSTTELAAAVARAPGTKVVKGPSRVTVGGRPATHVVLNVRRNLGCYPGFFFTWRDQHWGAFWAGTDAGDTIRVWIVDVRGRRLVIEAETKAPHRGASPRIVARTRALAQEIEKIVGSIRFD